MKVLFITSTRLGDAVLSTGLLDYIVKQYPESQVTVACGPLPKSLFEGFPNVERIITLKKQKRHGHWVELWKRTISTKWDIVVDLRNSAVSRLIRSKARYNFGSHIDKSKHKVEQAADVMKLSNVPAPKLYFTNAQEEFAQNLISTKLSEGSSVIAIGPSANWVGKTWESEKFIEVIKWLTSDNSSFPNAHVAVFAAPGEEEQATPVLMSVPEGKRINGIAKGNPGEVAAALSLCDFYLGNDSGLMHAAAAASVPTVGVFGPSYPHLYAPWGMHTAYARTPKNFDELIDFEGYSPKTLKHTLMSGLTVARVKEVIQDFVKTR